MNIGKKSGVERALIGTNVYGRLIVLATDGPWISNDCESVSCEAGEIGLVASEARAERGLYLWEGRGKVTLSGGAPWDGQEETVEYEGALRRVRPDEVEALYAMTPPAAVPPD